MSKDSLKKQLKEDILRKIASSKSRAAEYIENMLRANLCFYIPSPQTLSALISEWSFLCPRCLIVIQESSGSVTGDFLISPRLPKNFENFIDLKRYLSSHGESNQCATFVITIKEFFQLKKEYLSSADNLLYQNFSSIFINVPEVLKAPEPFVFSSFITSSPIIFNKVLNNPYYAPFSSSQGLEKSYYKSFLGSANKIFYLERVPKGILAGTEPKDSQLFEELLRKQIFHSDFLAKFAHVPIAFTSDKILKLFEVLEFFKGGKILIYFDNPVDKAIVYEIIKSRTPLDGKVFNLHAIFDKNFQFDDQTLNDTVILSTNTRIDVAFASELDLGPNQHYNIVFFNFYPFISSDFKIYLCPSSFKSLFKKILEREEKIARCLSQAKMIHYEESDISEDSTHSDPPSLLKSPLKSFKSTIYRFHVLDGTFAAIKELIKKRDFIIKLEKYNSKILVSAYASIGKVTTAFNIYNAIKQPVVVPRVPSQTPLYLFASSLELCTITSLKTVVNSKLIYNNGFLQMMDKTVIFYSFSNDRNLRFEFEMDDLDEYVILSTRKGTGRVSLINTMSQPGTTENDTSSHLKDYIIISFVLKNCPRVYSVDLSEDIAKKVIGNMDIPEKCSFFNLLEWKRLSSNTFADLKERFDLRISIPTFQSVSISNPSNFFYGNCIKSLSIELQQKSALTYAVVAALSSYRIQIVCSDLRRVEAPLSLEDAQRHFLGLDFKYYYPVLCLVSRKGRYLIGKLTQPDLEFISRQNIPMYCEMLDKTLKSRFEKIKIDIEKNLRYMTEYATNNSAGSSTVYVKSAVVTPLSIVFNYEILSPSNRVLRYFDPDKFLRVHIREEDGNQMFNSVDCKNIDYVYEYFRELMLNGIPVGLRKYFFLVMTTSQMKTQGSWFVTPYEKDGMMIGADYIKTWLGNFNSIKNIGKYAARIGLALSSTVDAGKIDYFLEVDDIQRESYCFSDGIGLISLRQAKIVSKVLGLNHIPSAYQIRFGGYKGILALHPWIEESSKFEKWMKNKKSNGKSVVIEDTSEIPEIIVRTSMKKFDSSNRMLEIIRFSSASDFYLNRQIILMLEGLGVSPKIFIDLQDKYILSVLTSMLEDYPAFIKKNSLISYNISTDLTFYRKMQSPILSKIFSELNYKAKIFIDQGRAAIGVLDELDILEEDQVFLMFRKRHNENMEGLNDYGAYVVPNTLCIVAKNPVMHPGDVRIVRCVDNPKLHYLKDVLVFSQKGKRPIFNQCSGSDLDGDIFLLSWCKKLIPRAVFKPYNYKDENALTKDKVLVSDIVNFYVRSMRFHHLGQIATNWMATADKYSVFNEKALKLSEIFNKSIDYVKTGNITAVSDDLLCTEYPDFMQKSPSYFSKKTLGVLYRRSNFDLSGINYCECLNCSMKEIQEQAQWKNFILMGSGVETRYVAGDSSFSEEDLMVFQSYKYDLNGLMERCSKRTEEELFRVCHIKNDSVQDFDNTIKAFIRKYHDLLKNKDSLKMAKIGECGKISSIEMLCGNSYKLRNHIKKQAIKEGSSLFVFNSKIHLLDLSTRDGVTVHSNSNKECNADNVCAYQIVTDSDDFYDFKINSKEIAVYADVKKYEEFVQKLNPKRKHIFKEAFNLILLSKYYKITEIDQIIDFLAFVNSEMKESSCIEFFRVALPGSNDVLFKIITLLVLNFSILKKSMLLREKGLLMSKVDAQSFRMCKRTCLVISGMLDDNDDIEFKRTDGKDFAVGYKNVFVPVLKNTGKCSPDYYRNTLRDFLVNNLYSHENLSFLVSLRGIGVEEKQEYQRWKEMGDSVNNCSNANAFDEILKKHKANKSDCQAGRAHFELIFNPGKFFFSSISEQYLNDRFSVKMIEKIIFSPKGFAYEFVNRHETLNKDRQFLAQNKIRLGNKREVEVLSFIYNNVRYNIEYLNGKLIKITKGKKILGKAFILNNGERNDLQVELVRSEIIFDGNHDVLMENEMFMRDVLFENIKQEETVKNDDVEMCTKLFVNDHKNFDDKTFDGNHKSASNLYKLTDALSDATKIKIEKSSVFSTDTNFTVVFKEQFASSAKKDILEFKQYKAYCYGSNEFTIASIDDSNFDRIYSKLWKLYTTTL